MGPQFRRSKEAPQTLATPLVPQPFVSSLGNSVAPRKVSTNKKFYKKDNKTFDTK